MRIPSLAKFALSILAIKILSIRDLGRLECVNEDMESEGVRSVE